MACLYSVVLSVSHRRVSLDLVQLNGNLVLPARLTCPIGTHTNLLLQPPSACSGLIKGHFMPRLYWSVICRWNGTSYKTAGVPQCPLRIVQWMESSPLRHLLSFMVMETIAHLSAEVVECVSTMVLSIGPQSYSHTEEPFSH